MHFHFKKDHICIPKPKEINILAISKYSTEVLLSGHEPQGTKDIFYCVTLAHTHKNCSVNFILLPSAFTYEVYLEQLPMNKALHKVLVGDKRGQRHISVFQELPVHVTDDRNPHTIT